MLSRIPPTLCSYLGKAGLVPKQQKLLLLLLLLSTGIASIYAYFSGSVVSEEELILSTPSFLIYLKWHIYVSGVFCLMFVMFENIKITIQMIIRIGLVIILYAGLLFLYYCLEVIDLTELIEKIVAVFFFGWIADIIAFVVFYIDPSIDIAINFLISYWIINHNISYDTNPDEKY